MDLPALPSDAQTALDMLSLDFLFPLGEGQDTPDRSVALPVLSPKPVRVLLPDFRLLFWLPSHPFQAFCLPSWELEQKSLWWFTFSYLSSHPPPINTLLFNKFPYLPHMCL